MHNHNGSIKIRDVLEKDKPHCLEFCRDTFSWGDYVHDAWDYWLQEKNSRLLVVEELVTKRPIAFCHVVFLEGNTVAWIEGIRVHPSHRNKGIAKKLVCYSETLALGRDCLFSYMLVASSNKPSMSLAKKLDYSAIQTWYYYSLETQIKNLPESQTHSSFHITKSDQLSFLKGDHTYDDLFLVKSWRWIPIDESHLKSLLPSGRVILSKEYPYSFAILTESKHHKGKVLVTAYPESREASVDMIAFLKSLATQQYSQVEILSRDLLPKLSILKRETPFHLLRKTLTHSQ